MKGISSNPFFDFNKFIKGVRGDEYKNLEEKEKREEKWMNVYLKGCCWLSTKISVKQLPYAPRIPDFARFVVNSL